MTIPLLNDLEKPEIIITNHQIRRWVEHDVSVYASLEMVEPYWSYPYYEATINGWLKVNYWGNLCKATAAKSTFHLKQELQKEYTSLEHKSLKSSFANSLKIAIPYFKIDSSQIEVLPTSKALFKPLLTNDTNEDLKWYDGNPDPLYHVHFESNVNNVLRRVIIEFLFEIGEGVSIRDLLDFPTYQAPDETHKQAVMELYGYLTTKTILNCSEKHWMGLFGINDSRQPIEWKGDLYMLRMLCKQLPKSFRAKGITKYEVAPLWFYQLDNGSVVPINRERLPRHRSNAAKQKKLSPDEAALKHKLNFLLQSTTKKH